MDSGSIVQAGNPKELFERPQTTFVGYFIGSPAMNIYDCTALSDFDVSIGDIQLKTSTDGIRSCIVNSKHRHQQHRWSAEGSDQGSCQPMAAVRKKLINFSFDQSYTDYHTDGYE